METKEYFENLLNVEKDAHPEFHSFLTVWVKSRQPEIYRELLSEFKDKENEIYAAQQTSTDEVHF